MEIKKMLDKNGLEYYTGKIKQQIPKKTSDLTNDSNFIDNTYHDNSKQDTLVSGTNIKTINNESLLGSGNISIQGGGTSTDVKINGTSITSDDTANIAVEGTYNASTNKLMTKSEVDGYDASWIYTSTPSVADFNAFYNYVDNGGIRVYVTSQYDDQINTELVEGVEISEWGDEKLISIYSVGDLLHLICDGTQVTKKDVQLFERSYNKITSLSSSSKDTQYPSAKCVYDNLATKQPVLVSGTNIKTINNESILGSGNINIQGGSGSSEWGNITGTLSDQTDLQTELSNKASKSLYSDTTINVGRKSNTTVGYNSATEGIDTTASGGASHAEGWDTTASGQSSHAEGKTTEASGNYSHAEGSDTTASGVNAHAEGEHTIANSVAQHVFGRYNISDTNDDTTDYGDYVEIVGNGSYNARSNARTLDWSGNETLAGDLTSSGTVKATKGLWSRPTGEVGTATSDSNSCLLIKRANNTEAPNNGVVLEFGNSANWRGQLYIGDNATQGIYYNGWSDGVRGSWTRLADQRSNLTTGGSAIKAGYQIDGKDVYVKRINLGTFPSSGDKDVSLGVTVNRVIAIEGSAYRSTDGTFFPLPFISTNPSLNIAVWVQGGTLIRISVGTDRSALVGWVDVYYI